jgi:uncharacterized membrane protein
VATNPVALSHNERGAAKMYVRTTSGASHASSGESAVSGRTFWPAIAVLVVGLFMLVAGIGPLPLDVLVVLLGIVGAVMSWRSRRQERRS